MRVLPLDRPDEVEVMSAFRPDAPYVYPEELLQQCANTGAPAKQDVHERPLALDLKPPEAFLPGEPKGDLVERGTGEPGDLLDEDELMEYSPSGGEEIHNEAPPEGPPVGVNEAPPVFDVDMQPEDDDDPMEVAALCSMCSRPEIVFAAKGTEESRSKGLEFTLKFGGSKVKVQVPSGAADEYTGATGEVLEKKLGEGMKLEMEELDHFGVCHVVSEKEALRLVREAKRRVLSTRWRLEGGLRGAQGLRLFAFRLLGSFKRDFKGGLSLSLSKRVHPRFISFNLPMAMLEYFCSNKSTKDQWRFSPDESTCLTGREKNRLYKPEKFAYQFSKVQIEFLKGVSGRLLKSFGSQTASMDLDGSVTQALQTRRVPSNSCFFPITAFSCGPLEFSCSNSSLLLIFLCSQAALLCSSVAVLLSSSLLSSRSRGQLEGDSNRSREEKIRRTAKGEQRNSLNRRAEESSLKAKKNLWFLRSRTCCCLLFLCSQTTLLCSLLLLRISLLSCCCPL